MFKLVDLVRQKGQQVLVWDLFKRAEKLRGHIVPGRHHFAAVRFLRVNRRRHIPIGGLKNQAAKKRPLHNQLVERVSPYQVPFQYGLTRPLNDYKRCKYRITQRAVFGLNTGELNFFSHLKGVLRIVVGEQFWGVVSCGHCEYRCGMWLHRPFIRR